MKKIYLHTQRNFEKLTSVIIAILGNSVTFILALGTVIFWFSNRLFYTEDIHERVGDIILGVTFLSLFVIQKSFSRFSASLHLKVNELVSSHAPASNAVINLEDKTEHEITQLSREYDLIDEVQMKDDRVKS